MKEILETTVYGNPDHGEIGIDRLVAEDIILASFPLHDGDPICRSKQLTSDEPHTSLNLSISESNTISQSQNSRAILNQTWSSYANWYRYQPIDLVKNYFGEKVRLEDSI